MYTLPHLAAREADQPCVASIALVELASQAGDEQLRLFVYGKPVVGVCGAVGGEVEAAEVEPARCLLRRGRVAAPWVAVQIVDAQADPEFPCVGVRDLPVFGYADAWGKHHVPAIPPKIQARHAGPIPPGPSYLVRVAPAPAGVRPIEMTAPGGGHRDGRREVVLPGVGHCVGIVAVDHHEP